MSKRLSLLVGLCLMPWAAFPQGNSLLYSEDRTPDFTYNVQGAWTVGRVAGFSQITHLTKKQTRRLRRHTLLIYKDSAVLWTPEVMSWRLFPTPVIGQETYDTSSREFWMDFRTSASELHLPRYVTAVDVEIGSLVIVDARRALLDYEGVWYNVSR